MDNSIYRWVKASERLPEAARTHVCRWPKTGLAFSAYPVEIEHNLELEWLEKVEADQQEKHWKEIGKRIMDGYELETPEEEMTQFLYNHYTIIPKQ